MCSTFPVCVCKSTVSFVFSAHEIRLFRVPSFAKLFKPMKSFVCLQQQQQHDDDEYASQLQHTNLKLEHLKFCVFPPGLKRRTTTGGHSSSPRVLISSHCVRACLRTFVVSSSSTTNGDIDSSSATRRRRRKVPEVANSTTATCCCVCIVSNSVQCLDNKHARTRQVVKDARLRLCEFPVCANVALC